MARFQLKYRNGPQRGQRLTLAWEKQPSVLMGRSRSATVHLPTPDISRQHCQLTCEEERVWIQDLGSRAGTYVNREKIGTESATPLNHRDKIQLGKWKFRFLDAQQETPSDRGGTSTSQPAAAVGTAADGPAADGKEADGKEISAIPSASETGSPRRKLSKPPTNEDTLDMLLGELDEIATQLEEGDFTSLTTIFIDSRQETKSSPADRPPEMHDEKQVNASEDSALATDANDMDANDMNASAGMPGRSPSPESLDLIAEAFKKKPVSSGSEANRNSSKTSGADRSGSQPSSGTNDASKGPANSDAESNEPAEEQRFQKLPPHLRQPQAADSTSAADEALKRIFGG